MWYRSLAIMLLRGKSDHAPRWRGAGHAILWGFTCLVLVTLTVLLGIQVADLSRKPADEKRRACSTSVVKPLPIPDAHGSARAASRPAAETGAPDDKLPTSAAASDDETAAYDPALAYRQNLLRFKAATEHRSTGGHRARVDRLRDLVTGLVQNAPGRADLILNALANPQADPYYRTVLLTCLAETRCAEAEERVWAAAVDEREDLGVRRRAAALLTHLETTTPRPHRLLKLITSDDPDIRVFGLLAAPDHMNEEGYRVVKRRVLNATDINESIAATVAVGKSLFPDKGTVLLHILKSMPAESKESYTDSAILKRTVVSHLDAGSTDGYYAARKIAADPSEAAGVRGRAILKCAEGPPEDALPFIRELVTEFGDEDVFLLQSAIQALARLAGAAAQPVIRSRLAKIDNGEIRKHLENVLEHTLSKQGKEKPL